MSPRLQTAINRMPHDRLRPNLEHQLLARPHAKSSVEDVGGAAGEVEIVRHGADLSDEFVALELRGKGVEGFGVDGGEVGEGHGGAVARAVAVEAPWAHESAGPGHPCADGRAGCGRRGGEGGCDCHCAGGDGPVGDGLLSFK